jgi:hypothetical protein
MRVKISVPEEHVSADVLEPALESVTRLNEQLIANGTVPPWTPDLAAHVRWKPEPWGDEHFDHAATALGRGWMDCDDAAPWKAASMRATGEDPGARAVLVPSGPETWHALVQRSDGSLMQGDEDISVQAGMGGRQQVIGQGQAILVAALDPHDGRLYQGSLLPTTGPITTTAGPSYAVRRLHGAMGQTLWQARCDSPIIGSRLIHVRAYRRHAGHRGRQRAHGAVPYSLACLNCAHDPHTALRGAVLGAMMLAPPAEHARYWRFLQG